MSANCTKNDFFLGEMEYADSVRKYSLSLFDTKTLDLAEEKKAKKGKED